MKNQIKTLINRLLTPYRYSLLNKHITHIHGPESFNYEKDELVVVCLVRDGQVYIRSFIEYYFKMGVKHIVFMDNGSKDATIDMAKGYENITILSCKLPFKYYKNLLKAYMVRRYCTGRWSLCVDIDELFDFPCSNTISLQSFLSYLNTHSYTAMITQMLDMFPDNTIRETSIQTSSQLTDACRFYDISEIVKEPYEDHFGSSNVISRTDHLAYLGGIRKSRFDIDRVMLTKHALVFLDNRIRPLYKKRNLLIGRDSPHAVASARLADITGVLYHYKFNRGLYEQALKAVKEENYYDGSFEYKKYLKILEKDKKINLKDEKSIEHKTVNQLVKNGFLIVSDRYNDWVIGNVNN